MFVTGTMRIYAKVGALAALGSLAAAQTRPFAHVETTCSAQATETVFVTVYPVESSIVNGVSSLSSTETHVLSTSTILSESGPPGITVTNYEQSAPSVTRTSSVGPAVSPSVSASAISEASSIVTIETFTVSEGPSGLPFTGTLTITRLCPGAVDCTGMSSAEPTNLATVASAPVEAVSTFILTTTITSGISPQVVETSTFTVIETLSSPVTSSTVTSWPTSASAPEISRSLSTASFTLTLGTVTVPSIVLGSSLTSSSLSPVIVTPYASATLSPPATSGSASVSYTVLTVTLPGLPGASPTVLTITATEAAPGAPLTPLPTPVSIVTMTTTVSSGGTEVSLASPAPTETDIIMTYTVLGPDGLALTTMTMATIYTYTPPAGVGTSYVPVSTVTAVNTVTVEGTLPLPPFPNVTTPFVTTITPLPSATDYTFTPPPSENTTTSLPVGNATAAPVESSPAITPGVTTIFVNGTPVATSIIVPVNATTLVAPIPGSPTETTPSPTELPPGPTELPPSSTEVPSIPTTNGTVSSPAPSESETETPPAPTNSTSSVTASVIIPLNSTTLALPLPTNGTFPGNVTASPTHGQGGASPTYPANGTASGSPLVNQTTSGNGTLPITSRMTSGLSFVLTSSLDPRLTSDTGFSVPTDSTIFTELPTGDPPFTDFNAAVGPTPSINGTTPAPWSNQTAKSGLPSPSQGGQGGNGGQGAPSGSPFANVTTSASTVNQTAIAGPNQSVQSAPSQGGQGGQSAPSQGGPSKSQGAPSQGAPSQGGQSGQGAPTQGGQGQSQSAPAQTPAPQSQGGQGQSQSAPAQTPLPQSQGGQGQSQGSQSRSQGGQSQGGQSQGGQGQSQGPQSRSQGQGQTVGAQPQGNADPLNTALGLPSPTGVPGASLSTLTTIITLVSRPAQGVKPRATPASPTAATSCQNAGDENKVVLDFDDLPTLQDQMTPGSSVDDVSPVALYGPYHQFTWSEGFRVFPSYGCPYRASSGEMLIEFSPSTKNYEAAEIGVGNLSANPCFRFDFASLRVGCASTQASCQFNVTGLTWDSDSQAMVTVASHIFSTHACSAQQGCRLRSITADLSTGLTNLTSILIDVTAGGQPQIWWADDLTLTWTDPSCESAVCRSGVRDFVPRRGRRPGQNLGLDTLP